MVALIKPDGVFRTREDTNRARCIAENMVQFAKSFNQQKHDWYTEQEFVDEREAKALAEQVEFELETRHTFQDFRFPGVVLAAFAVVFVFV